MPSPSCYEAFKGRPLASRHQLGGASMPDYICHGCNQKKSNRDVQECGKCGRILCNSCRAYKSVCKDSPKGAAGCDGRFKQR